MAVPRMPAATGREERFSAARTLAAVALLLCSLVPQGSAGPVADVRNTRHNLSASGPGSVRATSETQVCVFCHTPHAATAKDEGGVAVQTPLWNRRIPAGTTYTPYTSSSLDAAAIQGSLDQPGGSSKLCLSCHDGTLAIGNVNVLGGQGSATQQGTVSINMTGTGPGGVMPQGSGSNTGFTRNLGVDLTNDHPISVTYTSQLADRDGELRFVDANQKWPPGSGAVIGVRTSGYKPLLPLEPTGAGGQGQIQCGTCHDPHLRETDSSKGNQKFLRTNRFQEVAPTANYSQGGDIICLSCHDKNIGSGTWAYSSHANPQVLTLPVNYTYTPQAAAAREFPAGLPVWKAACLNCHDTHTVPGARRLAREGTDGPLVGGVRQGGNSAIEETCYQCHDGSGAVVTPVGNTPNVKSDFVNRLYRMPIRSAEQAAGTEVHDIGNVGADGFIDCSGTTSRCGKDFIESRQLLGLGNLSNRHAECTDCHNPHRVVKFRRFNGNNGVISGSPDAAGTHRRDEVGGYTPDNIASGVLRGAWGVEPLYGSASFHALPTSYTVKRGDPGNSPATGVENSYVTREYQICLKCHSDYGYSDNNVYPIGTRPLVGYTGGTPSNTNNLTMYTNQAKEFQAPSGHRGATTTSDSGAGSAWSAQNHRSWHPVIGDTGRTNGIRGTNASSFRSPWNNAVGTQTMYCSDCHGSGTTGNTIIPDGGENGNPWGPHGSDNPFILKGVWNANTGTNSRENGYTGNALCFKCHDAATYAHRDGNGGTGFCCGSGQGNLHAHHTDKIERLRCSWCHVAVPHGWKNKALLVNLNDVGAEGGFAPGTQVRNNTSAGYNREPYYLNAVLKVVTFATSGQWQASNCGSVGSPGNGRSGKDWMRDSNESCNKSTEP